MSLKRPLPFRRRGRSLPGQSSDQELGLNITFKIDDDGVATIINRELVLVGNVGAGDYVEISVDGIQMLAASTLKFDAQADGDVFIGQDTSDPAGTYLAIFANAQTYNGESVAAGDMLIGDNSSGKANIFWDKSSGRLNFRGGTTTAAYVDTDGSITAGTGNVVLDANGITITSGGTGVSKRLKFDEGGTIVFELYSDVQSGVAATGSIISAGEDSNTHEAILDLVAITDDGSAHAGAASVSLNLDTAADRIQATAERLQVSKTIRLTPMTTTTRDALSALDGMIVYNSTAGKFQGRAGGSWVDLH